MDFLPGNMDFLPGTLEMLVLRNEILHAGLAVDGGIALEGSDSMPSQYKREQIFAVMLRPKGSAEAERIFKALAEEGTVQIPLEETFGALRFRKVTDRFGVPWLINCEKPVA